MEPTALSQLRAGLLRRRRAHRRHERQRRARLAVLPVGARLRRRAVRPPGQGRQGELAIAMLRAYNDWHIDDWCGKYPGRFIPLAIPPIWDPEEMAREVRRVAQKGCHAITFADNPGGLGYPSLHSEHWDPFWKACADEGTVVCIHIGSGTGMNLQDPSAPVEIMIAATPITLFGCATELVFSEIFTQVPDAQDRALRGRDRLDPVLPRAHRLRARAPSPLDASQLPGRQEAERRVPRAHHHLLHRRRGRRAQPRPDRDRQHHLGVRLPALRHDLAARRPRCCGRSLAGVPDDDIHKITWQNAMRHFQYDPFKHIPKEQCTVGALRAQAKDVDLTLRVGGGGKQPSDYARGYATIGDIMKQMAGAFSTPFETRSSRAPAEKAEPTGGLPGVISGWQGAGAAVVHNRERRICPDVEAHGPERAPARPQRRRAARRPARRRRPALGAVLRHRHPPLGPWRWTTRTRSTGTRSSRAVQVRRHRRAAVLRGVHGLRPRRASRPASAASPARTSSSAARSGGSTARASGPATS